MKMDGVSQQWLTGNLPGDNSCKAQFTPTCDEELQTDNFEERDGIPEQTACCLEQ